MIKKWNVPEGVDEAELRQQVLLCFLNGETIRRTAKRHLVPELYVQHVLLDAVIAAEAKRRAADTRPPYERITVRQTSAQRGLVFAGKDCPVKKTSLRFHLSYEEASELIGWLNDEIVDEQDSPRLKALRNLLTKVQVEERRRSVYRHL